MTEEGEQYQGLKMLEETEPTEKRVNEPLWTRLKTLNGHEIRRLIINSQDGYIIYIFFLTILLAIIACIYLIKPTMGPVINENNESRSVEFTIDYTNCLKISLNEINISCRESMKLNDTMCQCIVKFNITSLMPGDVIFYFDLPALNQTVDINSRDNDQLMGVLSPTPSNSCEPYRYDESGRPILPCGALADSMFKDKISSLIYNESTRINLLNYGMFSPEDKIGFRNPKDLTDAIKDFSKPKSWSAPLNMLDKRNKFNNGFENEYFISWMRTDWKRKPVARLEPYLTQIWGGLPAGYYEINIDYEHPVEKYEGQRKVTIVATNRTTSAQCDGPSQQDKHDVGVTLLVLLLLILVVVVALKIYQYRMTDKRNRDQQVEEINASRP